jgi:drug/metabolite transporter (DMT)-like permease
VHRHPAVPFALLATVWGCSFALIAVSLRSFAPGQVAGGRIAVGALALLALSAATRTRLPRGARAWGHLTVVGVLLCVVPMWLFALAERSVPSSLASILNATTPLMTAAVATAALPAERLDPRRLGALLLGAGGVVLVVGPWRAGGSVDPGGVLACLGATACYGAGFVHLRRRVAPLGLPPVAVATGQVTGAAAVVVLAAPVLAAGPVTPRPDAVAALTVLGAVGTGLAYVWNARVVAAWGATRASAVTYLAPVVGVAVGVLALGERLAWHQPVGGVVVLAGVLLGSTRSAAQRRHHGAVVADREAEGAGAGHRDARGHHDVVEPQPGVGAGVGRLAGDGRPAEQPGR